VEQLELNHGAKKNRRLINAIKNGQNVTNDGKDAMSDLP